MALSNAEVLGNLKVQLEELSKQIESSTVTRWKLLGAIDVLEQLESEKGEEVVDGEEVERN